MIEKQKKLDGYGNKKEWKRIQSYLPKEYHLTIDTLPCEEWWEWKGHKIHLDTYRNAFAKAKVLLLHGVGTNGRQMTTILGRPLAEAGYEVVALDMPIYGETINKKETIVGYSDWVQCGNNYIDYELSKDERPIFLYGLSAGGMEAYHIAALNRKVKGIIGMTFLDQRDPVVVKITTSNWFWGCFGKSIATLMCKIGMPGFCIKMSIPSKMSALCNNEEALKAMLDDKTSAGNKVNMKFFCEYLEYVPNLEPEEFDVCSIILTQPEKDRWTPQFLSDQFLDRIKKVSVDKVILSNGSHYPIEDDALHDLRKYVIRFIGENL